MGNNVDGIMLLLTQRSCNVSTTSGQRQDIVRTSSGQRQHKVRGWKC